MVQFEILNYFLVVKVIKWCLEFIFEADFDKKRGIYKVVEKCKIRSNSDRSFGNANTACTVYNEKCIVKSSSPESSIACMGPLQVTPSDSQSKLLPLFHQSALFQRILYWPRVVSSCRVSTSRVIHLRFVWDWKLCLYFLCRLCCSWWFDSINEWFAFDLIT